jgi:hypothetical protein
MIEKTAAGPQHVLAGASRTGDGETAQRRADRPVRPKAPQSPCDIGLFSDEAAQADLLDLMRRQ